MTTTHYPGQELDIFAHATNWKSYWSAEIQPYLVGDVLEVGAGLGANTAFLKSDRVASWTCIEPDASLAERMRTTFATRNAVADCLIHTGTVATLDAGELFTAILYIDVLEHILDDRGELARASRLLRSGGVIVVLSPAHQWLYTPFDRAIGHVRRYTKATLAACSPRDCSAVRLSYLDCAGMVASLGNRLLLRQAAPELNQILFWDRFLVPLSRRIDPWTLHTVGKSILGIWVKL